MLLLQIAILVFVAISGAAVVFTRDMRSQVIGLSFYGLVLATMFFIYQAPDVALSQIVIGAVALPLMFMLAISKIRRNEHHREEQAKKKESA
jgi:energy-converting hydrogenase B subunit D